MITHKLLIRVFSFALLLTVNALVLSSDSIGQIKAAKVSMNSTVADSAIKPFFVGMATGTGEWLINDERMPSSAAFVSGSVLATGADADATLDLGALGQIQIRPNTTVKVVFSGEGCQIQMERCGSFTQSVPKGASSRVRVMLPKLAEVTSSRGEIRVSAGLHQEGKTNERYTIKAGKRKKIYNVSDIEVNGDSAYTVNCCQCCMVDRYHQ